MTRSLQTSCGKFRRLDDFIWLRWFWLRRHTGQLDICYVRLRRAFDKMISVVFFLSLTLRRLQAIIASE